MRRPWLFYAALGLILSACASPAASSPPPSAESSAPAPEEDAVPTPLPDGPLAPELTNDTWLNTEPLTGADLRGKVVLIDFWTFG